MTPLLVDTSAWCALADSCDRWHEPARACRDGLVGQRGFLVTNYTLDELYTALLMNRGHKTAVEFKRGLDALIAERLLEVVWVTPQLAAKAWDVFERFNVDKEWSFTDCVSYVVMKERGLTEAFAFDHHFDQMGFVRLP
ncbi:MAG: hypothetical protein COZ06_25770 [Armatimonadetes bacterium CG_4_10_14_3_um_filter_66_18]|nr:PIN domain-containing protein [Armatimonadota bacterium]PIU94891.1 MAG: hypothetical protein COS65_05265 [Armatimonadetes bacterium CG06_land_8_20_14_3_00_66_21]PIW13344.1 MAG: hypothetical protein COW34_10075 [Armatimonadetes bacterium CG17_big_fil_post_rev_8_21_14_2_50_66_6]PIX46229.1 MAG: hypothetical protein COZ57_13140 [Armatimonadetes bacterium CG_4_8_14_3_um_filter_66_20]PIY42166.1 MAG: hypothetical protein COZ06_25770 [Armatimonadetes bacterium CG_4_10_14_3_um_filter_66_18]PIZ50877.